MKAKFVMMLMLAAGSVIIGNAAYSQERVQSLRGETAISDNSETPLNKPLWADQGVWPREFEQQPPLIPHPVQGYPINQTLNSCVTCHKKAGGEVSGMPAISRTHYIDREGKESDEVTGGRYFCKQCHVEQRQTEPLVENTFEPGKG